MSGSTPAVWVACLLLAGACSAGQTPDTPAPPQSLEPGQAIAPDVELQQTGNGQVRRADDQGSGGTDSPAQPE